MASDRPGIKVTASDALEFEAVAPKVRKSTSALKTIVFVIVAVVMGAMSWAYYGERILSLLGNSEDKVPVIRADISPVKIRPENPGGLQVPDRDKLVYNRIQNGGTETTGQATVERLLPPPEKLLPRPKAAPVAPQKPSLQVQAPLVSATPKVADVKAAIRPAQAPPPPSAPTIATKTRPTLLSKNTTPVIPLKPVLKKSVQAAQPTPKPVVIAKTVQPRAPRATTSPAAAPTNKVYRVQLAAARTADAARKEWDRLRRKNLDVLGNLGLSITKVDLGEKKGVFYRLRAGPLKNDGDARTLCKTLAKRKTGCLIVRPGK
jgi:hypothetical protein